MSVQMIYASSHNKIAKHWQNLISIKHPFFFPQSIIFIEFLYLLSDSFRTSHDGLELINRSTSFGHLIEVIHTHSVRLGMVNDYVSNFNVLHNILLICLFQVIYIAFDCQPVQTEFVLYCKSLRPTIF